LRSSVRALLRTADTTLGDPAVDTAGEMATCRSRSSRALASACGGWSTGVVEGLEQTIKDMPRDREAVELFKKLTGPDPLPQR